MTTFGQEKKGADLTKKGADLTKSRGIVISSPTYFHSGLIRVTTVVLVLGLRDALFVRLSDFVSL